MPRRTTADLPLHSGHAPRWLFDRMVDLANAITTVMVDEFGPDEFVRRLADPYWFQALGCVLGFDWHSSGLTTTTMGALKEALTPENHGLVIAGGKGRTARQTPDEIDTNPLGLPTSTCTDLKHASRMGAAVDNGCVQDSYTLYHHTLAISETGGWCIVQQGMNDTWARRYHWLAAHTDSYVETPHTAICTQQPHPNPLDLTADASADTRNVAVDLVQDNPRHLERELTGQRSLAAYNAGDPTDPYATTHTPPLPTDRPDLRLPQHHRLRPSDLSKRALNQLTNAYEHQPEDFETLVGLDGIGPGALRALALIAELVYDADASHEDPAKYAFAHGGKDGTPYPVHRDRYDHSIKYLRELVEAAELDRPTRQDSLRRLTRFAAPEGTPTNR